LRLTRPTDGCRAAVWFWNVNGLSAQADRNTEAGFRAITLTINGGLSHYDERHRYWMRARSVLGAE
jgi:predicted chitinase